LVKVLFVAADTARSRAYAQALAAEGLAPDETLIFGVRPNQGVATAPWPDGSPVPSGLHLTRFEERLEDTAAQHGWSLTTMEAKSINAPEIIEAVRTRAPRMVVYSGVGGELVGREILSLGVPFLHAHSGWLPDKPGSTTIYYAMLEDESVGVSAFLLEPEIDTGPILARRRFPMPPKGANVDHTYDGGMRAAVIVDTVRHVLSYDTIPDAVPQSSRCAPYYVVHPVLKHLAMLRAR
jgi:methionyl-tRNA formyltransferase